MLRFPRGTVEEAECGICGERSKVISKVLGVCSGCIGGRWKEAVHFVKKAHSASRARFGLPEEQPKDPLGVRCGLCVNDCRIPGGERGYCGLRENRDGKLIHLAGTPEFGLLEYYYDPLPTNCVADWVCAGCTGAGYPDYSYSEKASESGYKNLAVFYSSCIFDCLFCQNWHYRKGPRRMSPMISASQLASQVDEKTSCICYFGGDPASQMVHTLRTSQLAIKRANGRILRICWETNGGMSLPFIKKAAKLSMDSGGCIKFDLKAWDENLHIALTGATNKRTLENFQWLAKYGEQRREPPFLVASTLLVPGYIDSTEVEKIAQFISALDPEIPYSLLAFSPEYLMEDMPLLSREQVDDCYSAAKDYLENVKIGNAHLLA